MYIEYPKVKYHLTGREVLVKDREEEAALGVGWADRPLDRYPGPRPVPNDSRAGLKWVDQWPVPNLSPDHRRRIKAQLLNADAAFWESPDNLLTVQNCMRRAFAGVAEVLFEAGILSEHLVENEIPEFVSDTAVAAGWWRLASETHQGISAQKIGHYWVWWNESEDWQGIFRGVTAEWLARLLDAQLQPERTGPHTADLQSHRALGTKLRTDRINQWIEEEGYGNQELADKLGITLRVVSSMRNNQAYHGRHAVEKLAKLMKLEATDLYLPLN